MIDQKAKDMFISVLEFKIDWLIQENDRYEKGFIDSLADVLEKTQAGMYDWYFDHSYNPNDDDASIGKDWERWLAMGKQNKTNFKKMLKYMTEDDYALCRNGYLSSEKYISERANGYEAAGLLLGLITT